MCGVSVIYLALLVPAGLVADTELKIKRSETPPEFRDKTIRSIKIDIANVFDDPSNLIYRKANELKFRTREEVVRRELLFTEGDRYEQFLIDESLRVLRQTKYLRKVNITPKVDGDFVDILISCSDTWTFIPQVDYSTGDGRRRIAAGLGESDLLGLGKRAEVLYEDDSSRQSIEAVYEDPRILGSEYRGLGAVFNRNDGNRVVFLLSDPFRTLLDERGWNLSTDVSDTVGRLFQNGDERFIYRQEKADLVFRYTVARGDPSANLSRFSLGYDYHDASFSPADAQDFHDIDLDPESVSHNNQRLLAEDRRYTGPSINYEYLHQDFISMNYIDRFERVEDYNLGDDFSINLLFAPTVLGSIENAGLLSANQSRGWRFGNSSFLRGEIGAASRVNSQDFSDSLLRTELRYYNVLGPKYLGERFIGRHTLAASFFLDFGDDLDRDREFLIGGDNALRGYKAKTFTGDKRAALNLEDRVHFVDDLFELVSIGGAVFLEAGGATPDPLGDLFSKRLYADAGVGLRIAFPRSSGERVLRIDLALPLRDGPDDSGAFEPRLLLSGGQLFGSRLRSETFGPEKASVEVGFDR
ncbi:MAG: BamA/TamA family outer membrane protein [Oligoflexia bacterium]|nr:BamA/TamA family outer membrane protein [Oligoflexia bacterium]